MKKVILIGGKALAGKDTTANLLKTHLQDKGYKVIILHYADFLKDFVKQHYDWNGKKDRAGRSLLQKVGTDIIRKNNTDAMVNIMVELIKGIYSEYNFFIIADTRFPNEVSIMKHYFDTIFIKVHRITHNKPNATNSSNSLSLTQQKHSSETALDQWVPETIIVNDTFNILNKEVIYFIKTMLKL